MFDARASHSDILPEVFALYRQHGQVAAGESPT
jgi:hypothetical protein